MIDLYKMAKQIMTSDISTEDLIDMFGNACLRAGKSNSGLCISTSASSDWSEMQRLRTILKERFKLMSAEGQPRRKEIQ